MPFYLYPASLENKSSQKKGMVIFWTYEFKDDIKDIFLHELRSKIESYLQHNFPFDKVLFLTHEKNKNQFIGIKSFIKNFGLAFSWKVENIERDIIFACFDQNGEVHIENPRVDFNRIKHDVLLSGLEKIFNRRGGIMGPSEHIHYVLPSGKHSNVFVRIGNILKKGVEINFIGYALLPYLRENTTNIYCDTSSIAVAAHAAVNLKKIINEHFVTPNIESFGSYNGLADSLFRDAANSLFLISVSSHSGLANKIYQKIRSETRDDYIITLFRLPISNDDSKSNDKHRGKILCDIEEIELKNVDKERIFVYNTQRNGQKCSLCENNSTSIEVIGDEFLTEKQETIPIMIREKNAPEWFAHVLNKLLSRNYISCHRLKKRGTGEMRELYLDINKLHIERRQTKNKEYNALFEKYLNQKLPAALRLIIYLNDEASKTIGNQIKGFYLKSTSSKAVINTIEYKDDPNFSQTIFRKLSATRKGAILVVSSSIAQSHSIVKISRDLRKFHDTGFQVCYFVSAVRTESKKEFEYIKSHLSFGKQFKSETNVFDSLIRLFIPDERHRADTPWQIEINKLEEYFKSDPKKRLSPDDVSELTKFTKRFEELKNSSDKGLVDNLFWETPIGKKQSLTPGFVFLKFEHDPKEISQADVYFTIASVLHFLRTEFREGSQVVFQQSEHQRKILDPENFSRFNDGVIQSSIIRAAYDIELDYSHDSAMSNRMKDIILSIVENDESASYEFLLALAISKIKLTVSDSRVLLDKISKSDNSVVAIFHSMWNSDKRVIKKGEVRF